LAAARAKDLPTGRTDPIHVRHTGPAGWTAQGIWSLFDRIGSEQDKWDAGFFRHALLLILFKLVATVGADVRLPRQILATFRARKGELGTALRTGIVIFI
jgi:hypothetical protein